MAFTQSDIDALKAAIATGALEVRYADGRYTRFRSLKEMRETLELMERDVRTTPRVLVGFVQHSRE